MAEEWGKFVIKGDSKLCQLFKEAGSDITTPVSYLASISGLDEGKLVSRVSQFDSLQIVGEYMAIGYESAEWRDFVATIFNNARGIEFYAHIGDEYGLNLYYSLGQNGEKIRVIVDFESDDFDEVISQIELGRWVASLPRPLTQALPDFNPLDEGEYIPPEEADQIDTASWIETDLFCYFSCPVGEETIRAVVPDEYEDFHYSQDETHSMAKWLPLSKRDKDTPRKVLDMLATISNTTIYANEFYEGSSHPYKLYKVEHGVVEVIFDSNNYKEDELKFLTYEKDEALGFTANWFSFDFNHLIEIHETYGLETYASKRIQVFYDFQKSKLDLHEKIWKEHRDQIEPPLKEIRFYLYYRKMPFPEVESLAKSLLQKGMFENSIEIGLGYSGKKALCGPEKFQEALECLQKKIPVLADYRIIIDNDCDSVVISTY